MRRTHSRESFAMSGLFGRKSVERTQDEEEEITRLRQTIQTLQTENTTYKHDFKELKATAKNNNVVWKEFSKSYEHQKKNFEVLEEELRVRGYCLNLEDILGNYCNYPTRSLFFSSISITNNIPTHCRRFLKNKWRSNKGITIRRVSNSNCSGLQNIDLTYATPV